MQKDYIRQTVKRRKFRKLTIVLASIIVFITTYSLILPGIALEADQDSITQEIIVTQEESSEPVSTEEQEPADREAPSDEVAVTAEAVAETSENPAEPSVARDASGTDFTLEVPTELEPAVDNAPTEEAAGVSTEEAATTEADTQEEALAEELSSAEITATGETVSADSSADADLTDTTPQQDILVLVQDLADVTVIVSYDLEAAIPADATLQVTEILPEASSDAYDSYITSTASALGIQEEAVSYARLFDISILDRAGQKVQPATAVSVSITVKDRQSTDLDNLDVVHFADGATSGDVMESDTETTSGTSTVEFETEGFSIYAIVASGETADLNGRTVAILNTYTNTALQDGAQNSNTRLTGASVQVQNGYVKANEDITFWSITSAGNGRYYIQNAAGQYLNINGTNNSGSVTVSTTRQALNVTVGTGNHAGMIRITNTSGIAINNYGGSTAGGFGTYNDNGNNEWFTLYELETVELNPAYAASKMSSMDLEDAQKVILYQTVYNAMSQTHEDYVIDGNGNLVKAYDKGDQVTLRSAVSPVWTVIMHRDSTTHELNGYYDFYNEETGLYLSPQADGTLVSQARPGVTLNGRRDGEYNSTIEKWDSAAWAWFGYQVEVDENGNVSLKSGTGDDSQALSFAAYQSETTHELHEVATVDSSNSGISIRLYDFASWGVIDQVMGSTSYTNGNISRGRVSNTLTNGFPTFTATGQSAANLFSAANYRGTGNYLFLESIYSATGYYEYNAFNNFAHYNGDGTFTVYQETGTPSNENAYYYKRGNFFPFNDIDVTRPATNTNDYDGSGNALDIQDPMSGSPLYLVNDPDFYFGVTVEATFLQPKNGCENDAPVIYEFNGDDDLWVYIDGVLILDIGGVHDAIPGAINFAAGEITGIGAGGATTIKGCFQNAGVFPDGTTWDDSKVDQYFKGNTFVDYGSHTMNMFYLEHGAGASNLQLRFNLPVIEKGKFTVEKELDGTSQTKYANVYFAYQAFTADGTALNSAVYENTDTAVEFFDNVIIGENSYDNVFYLKPGEAVTFAEMAENEGYYVQEIGIREDYYDQVIVNDVMIDGVETKGEEGIYRTSTATVANRARVTFTNHVSDKNRNELRITKRLTDDALYNGATFEFRVLLENAAGELVPYSTGQYYVQDDEGNYYRYEDGQLISNGKTAIVCSVAGNNGTIAGIPVNYTVVIADLLADTDFYVEEIRLPEEWELISKEVVSGTYAVSDQLGTSWAGETVTADGQIALDTDAVVIFTNHRKTAEITLQKVDVESPETLLGGAVFQLVKLNAEGGYTVPHEAIRINGAALADDGKFTVPEDEDKAVTISGLARGDYKLIELAAPTGYIIQRRETCFYVDTDAVGTNEAVLTIPGAAEEGYNEYASVENGTSETEIGTVLVIGNEAGRELPATGGAGTRTMYLVGTILVLVSAAALLLQKRRTVGQ